ncbi:uncharacterized membrane protein YhaH (DUF805 family) [Litorivivens lipolytica]|uniref:Uncharacterized membrane protein YhaH (DUF805 family) n=1 Tax=Litorivivens lipolytica TaxID=1524264 RepID=A0A7W4Z8D0_9GAMM|nr:DUF805 domain-containing protein [Litorivivens lipolytica]MBB3048890.1 uncharacterized membrane protein YhaH (DUF805 family) [Litorivivens lipolytica]
MNYMFEPLKKYATFEGRARRKEYWLFTLFVLIGQFVANIIDGLLVILSEGAVVPFVSLLFLLVILLPWFAVSVRRLHDVDRTGWWVVIGLIPLIGSLVLLVFACLDSQQGSNRFGANPKEFADQPAVAAA